jgi:dihydroorotate dehydrogenase (NAD+) catalytic subunit
MVWEVAQAVKTPVIGIGGIMNGNDAVEFLLAGATAVQVGTANFLDPLAPMKVLAGIESYLTRHRFAAVTQLVGAAIPSETR